MENATTKIIEAIRKLLALSKSPNEHEAALAMAKAQALLMKHNLDMAAIKTEDPGPDIESTMINEVVEFDYWQPWRPRLLNAVAKHNFCHVILTGAKEAHILGKVANVRAIVELYNWIEPQVIRLADKSGYKRGDKTAYIQGVVNTISQKLRDTRRDFEADNPNCRALIVNVQGEADNWYKQNYPRVTSRTIGISNGMAYRHGQHDGHSVSTTGASRQVVGRLLLA